MRGQSHTDDCNDQLAFKLVVSLTLWGLSISCLSNTITSAMLSYNSVKQFVRYSNPTLMHKIQYSCEVIFWLLQKLLMLLVFSSPSLQLYPSSNIHKWKLLICQNLRSRMEIWQKLMKDWKKKNVWFKKLRQIIPENSSVSPSDCRAPGICRCFHGPRNNGRISLHACATGTCAGRSHS